MKMRFATLASLSCALLLAVSGSAESKNPEEYPLRIHIFTRTETNFYHRRTESLDESRGDGRANLFAGGEVHGVDFNFECSQKLKSSFGFETYPAKWRKQGQVLTVLMPVFGKSGQNWTCDFKTDVKNVAYISHDGHMSEESPADFKTWMVKHNYDPEHGKDVPTGLSGSVTPAAAPAK